jgi:hypothetical protein
MQVMKLLRRAVIRKVTPSVGERLWMCIQIVL